MFSKGVITTALKLSVRFNMHRRRDFSINKNKVDYLSPRCRDIEHWVHMVRQRCTDNKRNEYLDKFRR